MRLLLDTCTFLWMALDDVQVSAVARHHFTNPHNDIFLSVVSGWEIAVKYAAQHLPLPKEPAQWVLESREQHGIQTLTLDEESVLRVATLPRLHGDPLIGCWFVRP